MKLVTDRIQTRQSHLSIFERFNGNSAETSDGFMELIPQDNGTMAKKPLLREIISGNRH